MPRLSDTGEGIAAWSAGGFGHGPGNVQSGESGSAAAETTAAVASPLAADVTWPMAARIQGSYA
jgi:hypothetical protein